MTSNEASYLFYRGLLSNFNIETYYLQNEWHLTTPTEGKRDGVVKITLLQAHLLSVLLIPFFDYHSTIICISATLFTRYSIDALIVYYMMI